MSEPPTHLPKINNLAAAICRIKLVFSAGREADATGFLYQRYGTLWLITNWHVVSGRHAETKELLIDQQWPVSMKYRVSVKNLPDITMANVEQEMYSSMDSPNWLVHPKLLDDVDVVAIRIPPNIHDVLTEMQNRMGASARIAVINDPEYIRDEMDIRATDDVAIGGYPRALQQENDFPIWKRAMIASEPDYDYFGLPRILIDGATRQGMSGGPVLSFSKFGRYLKYPNTIVDNVNSVAKLVGVYSSRVARIEQEAEFGYVWKSSVIDEIIDGKIVEYRCRKLKYIT